MLGLDLGTEAVELKNVLWEDNVFIPFINYYY